VARHPELQAEVVIVGEEEHPPYDRPPLSKELLAGKMERAACFYDSESLNVQWMLGRRAAGLDTARRVVTLQDGDEVSYDALLIATGRRAREWPALPSYAGFHMLRALPDAEALGAKIKPGIKVAIVGSGFIGCEVAATLRGLGVQDVTLIDVASHPMPVLGAEIGARAVKLHEGHGVRLRMSASVEGFESDDGVRVSAVRLAGGERVEADLVLLALGSVPNSEWLEGSGVQLVRGNVLCDEYCLAVGVEDVAAAGDVAAYPHPASPDAPICIEHWSNARDMGPAAALNLLSAPEERKPFVAVPTFWSDQYDVKIKSAGYLAGADSYKVVEEDPDKPSLVVEAYRGGELIGAVVFNKNRSIIQYQRTLADALPVAG
jgi:NADPH-dependent 2,4-dienoyl-CoA reductase/sulfur reductase-like enzyme